MADKTSNKAINIRLTSFADTVLKEKECVELDKLLVEEVSALEILCETGPYYLEQVPSEINPLLEFPRIWKRKEWNSQYDKHVYDKERSKTERETKMLIDENIRRICYAMEDQFLGFTEDSLKITAVMLLRDSKWRNIRTLGVKMVNELGETRIINNDKLTETGVRYLKNWTPAQTDMKERL